MEFYKTYEDSPYIAKNVFLQMEPEDAPLPTYDQVKNALPKPVWDGHSDAVSCYDYAWQIAFKNLQKADKTNHFVSNYIDTAFDMHPKVRQPFGVHICLYCGFHKHGETVLRLRLACCYSMQAAPIIGIRAVLVRQIAGVFPLTEHRIPCIL